MSGVWARLRHSSIIDYSSVGFYSLNSSADLGDIPDSGFNAIYNSECDSTCFATSVMHEIELMGPGGPGQGALIQAEWNWWGTDNPSSSLFDGSIDHTPWMEENPLAKRRPVYVERQTALPEAFSLRQNYPNPFNPATTIEFALPQAGRVQIEVFNILGQRVRRLIDQELAAGRHHVVWDGRDDRGRGAASGIYLYRVMTDQEVAAKKMVLLK